MAMDFKRAKKRARELLAPDARLRDLSASTLREDKLRDAIIGDAEKHTPRFQNYTAKKPTVEYEVRDEDAGTTEQRTFEWDQFGEAVRDCAKALFGIDDPELRDRSTVKPENQLTWDVMRFLVNEPEFRAARGYARMNEPEALFGAMTFADVIEERASELLAEHIAKAQEAGEQSQATQSAQDLFDQLRQQARGEIDQQGAVQPGTKKDLKGAYKNLQAQQAALGQILQQMQGSMQAPNAGMAAKAAAQAIGDAVQLMSEIPGLDDGTGGQKVDPEVQMELARKWNERPHLRKLLRHLGRFIRDMQFKRETRVTNVAIEPVEITVGRDLDKLVPFELARAGAPELQAMFLRDWSNGTLMQYEYEGRMPAGKGPLVFVLDCSGSMWEDRFVFASSVIIAGATICKKEKRTFAVVHYGASVRELQTWVMPKGEIDPEQLLDIADHFFGGGTRTHLGMSEAQRIIDDEAEFDTADVVLVSDGCDTFGEPDKKVRDALEERNVRRHGIAIMCPNVRYFEQMCDFHTSITDLALDGPNEATDSLAWNIT